MYDSIDGKKASVLKDVDATASDSIYTYKGSTTTSTAGCHEKDFTGQSYDTASRKCGYGICEQCKFV
jgi:hypothetical protein